ncbi:E3 ubiquitin-protein ligase RNF181 homolog [Linum grandiflorum]
MNSIDGSTTPPPPPARTGGLRTPAAPIRVTAHIIRSAHERRQVVVSHAWQGGLDFGDDEATTNTRGASESAIAKLEIVEIGSGEDCCPVCLEDMVCGGGTSGRVMRMDCKHEFHENCLLSWLKNSNSCPLCRSVVSD